MKTIGGLPCFEVMIDKSGNLVDRCWQDRMIPAGNLFVIVHGWNSDINDARALYERFFHQFSRTLESNGVPGVAAECAVLGVFWPSKKFGDPALTPGGVAGMTLRRAGTYHAMKYRAGVVGRGAIASILDALETRVHLIGHSFGARAITAAASATHRAVASMTLLQAAFSQNSFGPEGAFRNVITERKCAGPILITHSVHDEALGLCYPIASRILRQNASGLGDANDRYGALGRNGARHTPEASFGDLLPEGAPYSFSSGRIFNLCADRIIHSHADIVKPEIAWALIAAAGWGVADDTILRSG